MMFYETTEIAIVQIKTSNIAMAPSHKHVYLTKYRLNTSINLVQYASKSFLHSMNLPRVELHVGRDFDSSEDLKQACCDFVVHKNLIHY